MSKEEPHRFSTTVVPGVATAASPTSRDSMVFGAVGHPATPPHVVPPALKGVTGKKLVVHPAAVESA